MTPGPIETALRTYQARVEAAGAEGKMAGPATMRLILSGLDLDYEEIKALKPTIAQLWLSGLGRVDIAELFCGAYFDGLATGVLLERGRTPRPRDSDSFIGGAIYGAVVAAGQASVAQVAEQLELAHEKAYEVMRELVDAEALVCEWGDGGYLYRARPR